MTGRFESTPKVASRLTAAALLAAGLQACIYSVPLGGVAVGRGAPVGERVLELGMSAGPMAELSGTVPDLGVNPIPSPDSLTTHAGFFDLLGVTVGLTESVDVGINFSRGLHSVVRLWGDGPWRLSFSPAFHRYTSDPSWGGTARATNVNLTGLLSFDPLRQDSMFVANLYTGIAVNRHSASIDTGTQRASSAAVAPSVLAGLRLGGRPCLPLCGNGRGRDGRGRRGPAYMTFGVEVQGTWLRQRDARQDFVPTVRIFLTTGGRVRAPRPPVGPRRR